MNRALILDLDNTLVYTDEIKQYRDARDWESAYRFIPVCYYNQKVIDVIKKYQKKGVRTCVVSSSPRKYCEKVLDYIDLNVDFVLGSGDYAYYKPSPAPALKAKKILNDPEIVIGIGDNQNDYDCYKAAGIEAINVTWYENNHVRGPRTCHNATDLDETLDILLYGDRAQSNVEGSLYEITNKKQLIDEVKQLQWEQCLKRSTKWGVYFSLFYDKRDRKYCDSIINFKESEPSMVRYFKRFFIASFPAITGGLPLSDFLICMVPSHEKGKCNDGIANVISDCRDMFACADCSHLLKRTATIEKQSYNTSERLINTHLQSIDVDWEGKLPRTKAILFDDISTSGTSMRACEMLLQNRGIQVVHKVSLAYTPLKNVPIRDQAEAIQSSWIVNVDDIYDQNKLRLNSLEVDYSELATLGELCRKYFGKIKGPMAVTRKGWSSDFYYLIETIDFEKGTSEGVSFRNGEPYKQWSGRLDSGNYSMYDLNKQNNCNEQCVFGEEFF